MSSTSIIILILICIICILMITVVMVQDPKGGGLNSTFGGGSGGGQQMGGVKKTNDFLTNSTWTLATAVLVLILFFNVYGMNSRGSFQSKIDSDRAPVSAPVPDANQQSADRDADTTAPFNDHQSKDDTQSRDKTDQ